MQMRCKRCYRVHEILKSGLDQKFVYTKECLDNQLEDGENKLAVLKIVVLTVLHYKGVAELIQLQPRFIKILTLSVQIVQQIREVDQTFLQNRIVSEFDG